MTKNEIREKYKIIRENIKPECKKKWDKMIAENFLDSPFFTDFKNFLVYHPFNNEVDTLQIIKGLIHRGCKVSLPVANKVNKTMTCKYIKNAETDLIPGAYGIMEPVKTNETVKERFIEAVLVPGICFDIYGNRLGFGAGYYDRFLSKNKNLNKIGLSYEKQVYGDALPVNHNDIKMDYLITERQVFKM